VELAVGHRDAVVEQHLADAGQVRDRDVARGLVVEPGHVLVERGEGLVDLVGERVGGGADVLADDVVLRERQLLIGQLELDFLPAVQADVDRAGRDVLRGGGGVLRREGRGAADGDGVALLLRVLGVAAMHATGHAQRLLELDQGLLGVENRIVDAESVRHRW
jgi:hypothetical protein